MATTYSTNLGIALPGSGEQSGTWGLTTNTNLGTLIEQAVSGYETQAITDGSDTTITIPNGATGTARNMYLELTGTLTANRNLIVPTNKKLYFIYNNTTGGYAVTVKPSSGTGVSVPNGAKYLLVSNGTNIIQATNFLKGTVSYTVGDVLYADTTSTLAALADVATGNALISGGVGVAPSWGKVGLTTHVSGTLPVANGGTGATTQAGARTGLAAAASGTNTDITSLNGLLYAVESATVSATATSGTINYDTVTQSVLYYTTNATGNFVVNVRGNSSTTLNSILAVGGTATVAFMVTNGATAYYNTSVQVDGTTTGVTTKWQGGTAPSSGNTSSIDVYTYTIIKTASATFTVLASQTKFA